MADKSYINNVQDLDQIIFFTGQHSTEAASYVANRNYGASVEGLGNLTYNSNYEIYYSSYPDVKYVEKRTDFKTLNDLYETTLSYLYNKNLGFSVGYTYASQNRYHAIYDYEEDFSGDLDYGEIFITRDLNDFLIGLNNQVYNKQRFYGNKFEVSSIKIDNTYYNWYPKDSVAYVDTVQESETVRELEIIDYNGIPNNIYDGDFEATPELIELILRVLKENNADFFTRVNGDETEIVNVETLDDFKALLIEKGLVDDTYEFDLTKATALVNQINELHLLPFDYYLHANDIENVIITNVEHPYIIGGETGNYYSYVRNLYYPIEDTLKEKISGKINEYKEDVCNNDSSIYAYYIDRCNPDVEMLLTTLNFGVKQSTFKIGIESRFNRWFDDTINIHAALTTGDNIFTIASYKNGEIFSTLKNKITRIAGENVEITNKDIPYTFVATEDVALDEEINILTPGSIETLDLSPIKTKIGNILDLTESEWHKNKLNLKHLILDDGDDTTLSNIEKIFGLNELTTLEYVDLSNVGKLKITPAFDKLENLKVFKAKNSNIDSFRPKKGIALNYVQLPESVKSIKLDSNVFEPGEMNILGVDNTFDGVFDYAPTKNLISLTLRNIDNELSYKLVFDWYNVLEAENLLDTVIYLELQGISWKDVPVQRMINLKRFDINPNFSGEVKIVGSGNYKWLTRNEYQDITTLYGLNAFLDSYVQVGKTFKDLTISRNSKIETFEYSLSAKNLTVEAVNVAEADNRDVIKYKENLNIVFNHYLSNGSVSENTPYLNRAANSLLDIINEKKALGDNTFTFIKGELGHYAYCRLNRSIDTSSSNEIRNIKAGDILLLNGDTLVVFFEDVDDNNVEYVKIGEIVDESVEDKYGNAQSSVYGWFEQPEVNIEFITSERETVIQELTITSCSDDVNEIFNNKLEGINIAVDIDDFAINHLDEIKIKDISVEVDKENVVVITELGEGNRDGHYRMFNVRPADNFEFTELTKVNLTIFCPAEKDETSVVYEIMLRKVYTPSIIDEETLVLDSDMYSVVDDTLIINSQVVNAIYDETTETLTID